ncbi:MAG: hypothetical protein ACKVP7_15395 [Hyphomicrobiaceae bacterium]
MAKPTRRAPEPGRVTHGNLLPRPGRCEDLLTEDVAFDGWEVLSAYSPRFYVTGLFWFLREQRRLDVRFLTKYADMSKERMRKTTKWMEFPAPWDDDLSYNQFRHVRNRQPVMFHKAVQVIFTCEVALEEERRAKTTGNWVGSDAALVQHDIYTNMRIIPAVYNIDRFSQTLVELRMRHESALPDVLAAAKQKDLRLLEEIASGYCVTRETAVALHDAVVKLDPNITIGEVRFRPGKKRLGKKRASHRESVELS